MTPFDIVIGVITLSFIIRGWVKGFINEFFNLLTIFLGLYLSFTFYQPLAKLICLYTKNYNTEINKIAAFIAIFFANYIIIQLIKTYLFPIEKIKILSLIDKIVGGMGGFLLGILITYGIGYCITLFYNPLIVQNSKLFPIYEKIVKFLFNSFVK